MTALWEELRLAEEVKHVSRRNQVQMYNEYMDKLEQKCVADLTELFLERSDLFDQFSTAPLYAYVRCILPELKVLFSLASYLIC